jgi:hypothetical protein
MNTRHPCTALRRLAACRRLAAALSLLLPLMLPLAFAPAHAAGSEQPVGHVTFAVGEAYITAADGSRRPARADAPVYEGERLATGGDGYLHLRMVDDAFAALRPGSVLRLTRYAFDPARPKASRIRLDLDTGNARAVSGRGGEAARRHYRFATPLAAIGLRGTDYTVRVFDQVTRVSVRRGAVSVTPLGGACSAAGEGPCQTSLTRELTAQMPHAYLELSARNPMPVLVLPEQDPNGAAGQNPPPGPGEPQVRNEVRTAPAEAVNEVLAGEALDAVPIQPPAQLVWGRWSNWASGRGAPPVGSLLSDDREVMVGNDAFGLLRDSTHPTSLPTQGKVDFGLAAGEAYLLSGGNLSPAQVRAGSLGVDFRDRSFTTHLDVQHAQGRESLHAAGNVQFQGFLVADPARSNMNLQGALARDGSEAAYLFDKQVTDGALLGAVRWLP